MGEKPISFNCTLLLWDLEDHVDAAAGTPIVAVVVLMQFWISICDQRLASTSYQCAGYKSGAQQFAPAEAWKLWQILLLHFPD